MQRVGEIREAGVLRAIALLLLLAAGLLAACGSHHAATSMVASVGNSRISVADLQKNVSYAARFFSSKGVTATGAFVCGASSTRHDCTALRRQVLIRMIEERVVLQYAGGHHIVLDSSDQSRLAWAVANLGSSSTSGSTSLSRLHLSQGFLTNLLGRQMLVQKVEKAVVPVSVISGTVLHLRKFIIPAVGSAGSKRAHGAALVLATDGAPIPIGTSVRTEWEAPFRLPAPYRTSLAAAHPGDFIGPFSRPDGYEVIEFLGKAWRRYGGPARIPLEQAYFRSWLLREIRLARPVCFSRSGSQVTCPVPNH